LEKENKKYCFGPRWEMKVPPQKACLIFKFLNGSELAEKLLNNFSFYCIPMLNPDGAKLYTRLNANQIDLNRDLANFYAPASVESVFEVST
jgi:murein tripeptide amidase MpaA